MNTQNPPKSGPYYPMYSDDFDQGCRSASLDPAQTGAYVFGVNLQWRIGGPFTRVQYEACTPWHPRTSSRLLNELVERRKFVEADGRFSNARMAAEIAKFRDRSAAASAREQRKKQRPNSRSTSFSSGEWRASKAAKLSEKRCDNNEAESTETALLRIQNLESSAVVPSGDAAAAAFERFWETWPESDFKRSKAECLRLYRIAIDGDGEFEAVTPDAMQAAVVAHGCKHAGRYAGAPRKWLEHGGWLDYAKPVRHIERNEPGASNLPLWETPERLERGGYKFEERLLAKCRKHGGWDPEFGPAPVDGEPTALLDRIVQTPGLIDRLERECGIEFPSSMRDAAEMAAPGNILPFALRSAGVGGRASA